MKEKLFHHKFKTVYIVLLLLAFIGAETTFVQCKPGSDKLKLEMDTHARVALIKKQKELQRILDAKEEVMHALDQVAPRLSSEEKCHLAQHIYTASIEQDIDPRLIIAMITTESSFRKRARSRAGAHGLMQVKFATAKEVAQEIGVDLKGRKSLYNPELNIKMGTYYLGKMVKRFDNLELALTAYNMGPTALRKRIVAKNRVPKRYSRKVLALYKQL